jgi:signal peptidase II
MDQPATSPLTLEARTGPALAWRTVAPWLGLATVIVAVDQGTKAIVRAQMDLYEVWPVGWEIIRFQHVQNTGAAFGILQGAGTFLVIATFGAIVAITLFLLTLPAHGRLYHVALTLILGGAVGNLIDRIRLGAVTDFIDPTHYPAFNLADSCIVCGVALLGFLAFRDESPAQSKDQS